MTCPLCDAIRAGLPVTDDTPLPCRLRPTSHHLIPSDPFHGAVFDLPPGQKEFDPEMVRALHEHQTSTTPEERTAAHEAHLDNANAFLRAEPAEAYEQTHIVTWREFNVTLGGAHPLDVLTRKD